LTPIPWIFSTSTCYAIIAAIY